MDSKEGIEKVAPVDAQAAGLLDPSFLRPGTEFLVYRVPKTTRGMSDCEARCYADFIMGSYLWAGSPATLFVTKRPTQEDRRDKVKTREYHRKITVRRLAATQARLKDRDGNPETPGMCHKSGSERQGHDT